MNIFIFLFKYILVKFWNWYSPLYYQIQIFPKWRLSILHPQRTHTIPISIWNKFKLNFVKENNYIIQTTFRNSHIKYLIKNDLAANSFVIPSNLEY